MSEQCLLCLSLPPFDLCTYSNCPYAPLAHTVPPWQDAKRFGKPFPLREQFAKAHARQDFIERVNGVFDEVTDHACAAVLGATVPTMPRESAQSDMTVREKRVCEILVCKLNVEELNEVTGYICELKDKLRTLQPGTD